MRGYFREKIFSREDIFAGRYFRVNSKFAKISSRENISISLFAKFSSRENKVLYSILTVNSIKKCSNGLYSMKCFETRDTNEKLTLNCGVTVALCHSALARSESDDWPVQTRFIGKLKP